MQIYWNGKPRAEWRAHDDRNVRIGRLALPISGRVLSPEAAKHKLEAADKRRGLTVALVIGLSLAAGLIGAAASAKASGHILLLALGFAGFFALNFLPETHRHRRALERQRAASPPEGGGEIRIEADRIVYAGEVIAWRELEATRLDVRPVSGDTDEIEVDGVTALAGERCIAFDRFTQENGAALVNAAYDILIRQRGLAS